LLKVVYLLLKFGVKTQLIIVLVFHYRVAQLNAFNLSLQLFVLLLDLFYSLLCIENFRVCTGKFYLQALNLSQTF